MVWGSGGKGGCMFYGWICVMGVGRGVTFHGVVVWRLRCGRGGWRWGFEHAVVGEMEGGCVL